MALYYFSYGANMDPADVTHRCNLRRRTETRFSSSIPAFLTGYRLVTNAYCDRRQSGVLNLRPSPEGVVHGVLYEVSAGDAISTRDLGEGRPETYQVHTVTVTTEKGHPMPAAAFIARPKGKSLYRPAASYMAIVINAARRHGLPEAWVRHLEAFPTVPDGTSPRSAARPDPKKRFPPAFK